MKTRLYNAKILTMQEGQEIFDGEIIVEDGRIVKIGNSESNKNPQSSISNIQSNAIDCQGNLLMPVESRVGHSTDHF